MQYGLFLKVTAPFSLSSCVGPAYSLLLIVERVLERAPHTHRFRSLCLLSLVLFSAFFSPPKQLSSLIFMCVGGWGTHRESD